MSTMDSVALWMGLKTEGYNKKTVIVPVMGKANNIIQKKTSQILLALIYSSKAIRTL